MSSIVGHLSQDDGQGPPVGDVDASFRPVALLFVAKSALWLIVGSLLSLLASVKLHSPSMMSGAAWLTYGRLVPAGWDALIYGFAGQAGMILGLWTLARSSGARLKAPLLVAAGGVLWNLGVLTGVVGILMGHSTGREWLEMPPAALALLTIGASLIGTVGWVTFTSRTTSKPFPSAWFILLALVSFVWFASVALAMLGGEGQRGVMQVLVQRWYANGLQKVWLGGFSLGLLFYALPRAVGRALSSRELSLVAFWSLVLFAPWAITAPGDPFPRWVVSLGMAGHALAAVGILAVAVNAWKTSEGIVPRLLATAQGRLIAGATIAYIVAGALQYLAHLRQVAAVVRFTWLTVGIDWLIVAGAVGWVAIALIPEFVERATGRRLNVGLTNLHANLSLAGVAIIAVSLILAGIVQGMTLSSASKAYMDTVKASMNPVRLSSLGFVIFFVGQLAFGLALVGFGKALVGDLISTVKSWAATPGTKGAGVRS